MLQCPINGQHKCCPKCFSTLVGQSVLQFTSHSPIHWWQWALSCSRHNMWREHLGFEWTTCSILWAIGANFSMLVKLALLPHPYSVAVQSMTYWSNSGALSLRDFFTFAVTKIGTGSNFGQLPLHWTMNLLYVDGVGGPPKSVVVSHNKADYSPGPSFSLLLYSKV